MELPLTTTTYDVVYNKTQDVKAFEETKAGVKGLVDSGITSIPRFFIHPNLSSWTTIDATSDLRPPLIDMLRERETVVREICVASETWGLFQLVNHGIPTSVMEEMLAAVSRFHEQPAELKVEMYSRDGGRKVRYFSNGDLLVSKSPANWRDTLSFYFQDGYLDPQLFPQVCREAVEAYMENVFKLKKQLSELVSEAAGLHKDYLASIGCMETVSFLCHYYPSCPQPNLTLGATNHMDPSFLTILLQDHKGGLQVLYRDQWVNVIPLSGALIVNIGDFMQLITNDKFKSAEHRVVVGDKKGGSRVSVASLFYPSSSNNLKSYGPPNELLSPGSPPIYRATHFTEFMKHFRSKGLDGKPVLSHFRHP
ncbi:1-aminocyclopropane-1-carboxylate oxidase homolog 12 [Linum grandiflorum]